MSDELNTLTPECDVPAKIDFAFISDCFSRAGTVTDSAEDLLAYKKRDPFRCSQACAKVCEENVLPIEVEMDGQCDILLDGDCVGAKRRCHDTALLDDVSSPSNTEDITRSASVPTSLNPPTTPSTVPHRPAPDSPRASRRASLTTPPPPPPLEAATWNLASPNNNPFEFWATLDGEDSADYTHLMSAVGAFIEDPGARDAELRAVFTPAMLADLRAALAAHGVPAAHLDALAAAWEGDLSRRTAVWGFLRDGMIGSKRLISMPDRITNIVVDARGAAHTRPSPISAYSGDMGTVEDWWPLWMDYMFHTHIPVKSGGEIVPKTVMSLIERIPRSKYPDLTPQEEEISIPLQALTLALFDAVLVHILHSLAPHSWQRVKRSLHKALYENRAASCVSILRNSYASSDLLFLQEASASFVDMVKESLNDFILIEPPNLDRVRNQNSLILARRSRFVDGTAVNVTKEVVEGMVNKSMLAPVDLIVVSILSHHGPRYLLASFHSDSCGLATTPVLDALHSLARSRYPDHVFILGLDANTFSDPAAAERLAAAGGGRDAGGPGPFLAPHLSAAAAAEPAFSRTRSCNEFRRTASSVPINSTSTFHATFSQLGMESCWGDEGHVTAWTTCIARTFLQPQLHKAVSLSDALSANHCHLKDWVLYYGDQLTRSTTFLDNTGDRHFAQRVFPAKAFPSDHAIVVVTLHHAAPPPPPAAAPRRP